MTEIKNRLGGVAIEGPLEPATALLEHAVHQHETKTLKHLPPEKCYSRELEIKYAKPAKTLQVEGRTIAFKEGSNIPAENVYTSLQFQQAMTRRAIAYDFANLISFNVSRRYIDIMLRHLSREPPPGYTAATVSQLIKADQQVWAKLAAAGSNIRRTVAGDLPLDTLLIETVQSYEISFYLMPLPTHAPRSDQSYHRSHERDMPYHSGSPKGKGKGKKGKRKGRSHSIQSWVPPKLRGGRPTNPAGDPICFNYNLDQACPRGPHICCKCFKHHPFTGNHEVEVKANKP